MAHFKSALDDVRRSAQGDFQRTLKTVAAGAGGALSIISGNGIARAQIESDSRQRAFDSREQLKHFRNQVYTSIRPIAQTIAGQPFRLAKIDRAPKSRRQRVTETRQYELPHWVKGLATGLKGNEDFTIVDQHQILDYLNHPAPSLPGWQDWSLKYVTVASLELTGYAYWWLLKVGGRTEIWHVPSSWMRPRHSATQLFVGWDFLPEGFEEPIPLDRDEVVPFWYPDPANTFNGLGPLEAGAQTIMVDEFVIEAQKRSFQLGIHPSAIIKMTKGTDSKGIQRRGRLREHQREQTREALYRHYRGLIHYGDPMILDGRVESVEPYGNKPSEMDFGTNADSAKARVEQCFGTNPYTAGGAGLSSRAESAESDRHFVSKTANPKIELLSRVMTLWVLPQFDRSGQYVLFIEPARPNDAEMTQKEWEDGLKYGCVTVNEYRSNVLRQPPIPGGDVALVPQTYQYATIGQTIAKPIPSDGTIAPSDPVNPTLGTDAEDPESENAAEAEGEEASKSFSRSKAFDDGFYDQFATDFLKAHGEQEQSMSDAIDSFFSEQADDVAAKLEAIGDSDVAAADSIVSSVFDAKAWDDKLRAAVKPSFAKAMGKGAAQELDAFGDKKTVGKAASIGFDFGVDLPPAVLSGVEAALTEAMAKSYWADVQQTTRDQLAASIKDGLEAGEPMRDIVKRVKTDVFSDSSKERARNIARTETTNALGAGAHEARKELASEGVVTGKEWFATFDGLTRDSHLSADGQRRGVDEPFDVGGESARWPGDPNLSAKQRINCRCASASVTPFSKRTRAPHVKAFLSRGCEIHGKAA